MTKKKTILVKGAEIKIEVIGNEDYISLTDITKNFPDGKQLVPRWIRNRDTLEFLGVWEKLNNLNFQVIEFDNLYAELIRMKLTQDERIDILNQAVIKQMKSLLSSPSLSNLSDKKL